MTSSFAMSYAGVVFNACWSGIVARSSDVAVKIFVSDARHEVVCMAEG